MVNVKMSRLVIGVTVCLFLGVLTQAAKLWLPIGPFSPWIYVLLSVLFWFILVVGAVLLVGAVGWWPTAGTIGTREAKGGLLLGVGLLLAALFVDMMKARSLDIYTGSERAVIDLSAVGSASFGLDAFSELLQVTSGILIALGCLVLFSQRSQQDDSAEPAPARATSRERAFESDS